MISDALFAISKIPDSMEKYPKYSVFKFLHGAEYETFTDLRQLPLVNKDIFRLHDDSSVIAKQARKEYFKSLLSNNHEIDDDFINAFKSLNDKDYAGLKHDLIDTALFSKSYAERGSSFSAEWVGKKYTGLRTKWRSTQ